MTTRILSEQKTCFRCGTVKPLERFYAHPGMSDGRLNKCIDCTKEDVRSNRKKNRDRYNQKDRERGKLPARLAAIKQRILVAPKKRRAIITVNNRISRGKLQRQPCEVCGATRVDAHHDDYNKPLEVRWLCREHHQKWHAANGPGKNGDGAT